MAGTLSIPADAIYLGEPIRALIAGGQANAAVTIRIRAAGKGGTVRHTATLTLDAKGAGEFLFTGARLEANRYLVEAEGAGIRAQQALLLRSRFLKQGRLRP